MTIFDAAERAATVAAMIDHHLSPLTATHEGVGDLLLRDAREALDRLISALAQLNPAIVAGLLVLDGQMTAEDFETVVANETLLAQGVEPTDTAMALRRSELRTSASFISAPGADE